MSKSLIEHFQKSLETGFIDKSTLSDSTYQPELLVNIKKPPKKVLTNILQEFNSCNQFWISVAFVTRSGVAAIINTLKTLEERGIPGKILVSQYLNFTEPEALKTLLKFTNIELKIATKEDLHSKGYIFKNGDYYNLIIGSSNLTANALQTNKEWNLKVSGLENSALVEEVLSEFKKDFNLGVAVTEDFIISYSEIHEEQKLWRKLSKKNLPKVHEEPIVPNSMQHEALSNLKNLRNEGKEKALIISATGTGKTYLAAFDAMEFQPKRLLFVVHRLTIAKKAKDSFEKIFGKTKSTGLYSGNQRELSNDFIFSTVQTISKQSHLEQFTSDYFDYIIIDESHRSGADSYIRLLNHFKPSFLLGMTATPERTDGNDIFRLFDYNIGYEIRLNRAMEEDMLCQFHYYGVTDLFVSDELLSNNKDFNLLIREERVSQIIKNAHFYGSDNGIIRGLAFCSRKEEAVRLSHLFNMRGFKTVALTGDSTEVEREKAIATLEEDDLQNKIDYIFTVDIFNEGVDIPKVNQILMIRPTNSAIIFVQQLGRGLRKIDGKGYLTIIDFIGNYKNNYLIPIALYGDTSFNKDKLRRLLSEGSKMIPGASTINFDEITKDRIFKSIDTANMQLFKELKKDYDYLKSRLGHSPMMMDFIRNNSRDPYLFVDYSNSYYNFVCKVEKHTIEKLNAKQVKLLELFSKEINNAKRVEESIILRETILHGSFNNDQLREAISVNYGYSVSDETITSCTSNLSFEFVREKSGGKMLSAKEIHKIQTIKHQEATFYLEEDFQLLLKNNLFKQYLLDTISFAIHTFSEQFDKEKWVNGFVLYRKYSRKDVFRILNVKENPIAQNVGGYLVSPDNRHCPIFVNYQKDDDISESTKYEDKFVNNKEFDWMSKSNRKLKSNDVQSIMGKKGKIRLPLFIKKNNDEGMEFYFMGDVNPVLDKVEQATMKNNDDKEISVVKFRFKLEAPVSEDMYSYLTESVNTNSALTKVSKNLLELIPSDDTPPKMLQIPLYNFYAAAGTFSEMQYDKDFELIDVPEKFCSDDYFACKVVGDSMNRVIPNGSVAIFKKYLAGGRSGKIVLVENNDIQDPDFKSAFTVKTYTSEKVFDDNTWQHKAITLKPNSYDSDYTDIILDEESARNMRIVGEFMQILT
jgi:superfamily II DNA or RNA helicase/HKD family nuclease/SOS-response transcriptional repressor LexA